MTEFSGFYKLPIEERIRRIAQHAKLSKNDVELLKNSGALSLDVAEKISENVVGAVHLPLGLGLNFKINGKEIIVPMSIEEPSVVAAASNGAKLCLPKGFEAGADESVMVGEVQIVGLDSTQEALDRIDSRKKEIEKKSKDLTANMGARGGGFRRFYTNVLETTRGKMLIVYFEIDVQDAMGANTLNTMLEEIAPELLDIIDNGTVRVRVLSNLADKRKAWATAIWKKEVLGEECIEGVLDAYELARNDVYRACTHNKGIMNGVDAVVLATGNDWRAVEAGAHAYASRSGRYMPLTHYEKDSNGDLIGKIELPVALGIVGGSINSNEIAKISLKILDIKSARELAMICACVGLANNFAALRALGTEGIQKGHMKLHKKQKSRG